MEEEKKEKAGIISENEQHKDFSKRAKPHIYTSHYETIQTAYTIGQYVQRGKWLKGRADLSHNDRYYMHTVSRSH